MSRRPDPKKKPGYLNPDNNKKVPKRPTPNVFTADGKPVVNKPKSK